MTDNVQEPERQAFQRERGEPAKAESTARTLQAELTELRDESRRATETVAVLSFAVNQPKPGR